MALECIPNCRAYAQVTMTCPPPILPPTRPEPVKPLQLPCPKPLYPNATPQLSAEDRDRFRYDNFYNHYNIVESFERPRCPAPPQRKESYNCEDYTKRAAGNCELAGCPTGFKPCTMKMTPPPCCDLCGVWSAQVQPCPPKPKKRSGYYKPGPCSRPCCKHWGPSEGPCLYDDPCKAHCYNHPPGVKPSGRFP